MLGRTHQIIGLAAGVGYYLAKADPVYAPATMAAVIVASSIGSLIPDLDRSTASVWEKIPYGKIFGKVVDPFIDHRSFSHSLFGLAIFGYLLFLLLSQFPSYWGVDTHFVLISFLIAYSSHLVADMVTVEGIPLFFPYPKFVGIPPKPFEGARIITGKWFENLIIFPVANIIFLIIIFSSWQKINDIFLK